MEDKYLNFVNLLGPGLYKRLAEAGVLNIDVAWDHMMRQLAYESSYGDSAVAKRLHNYGGYGWNGKTYTTFKDDDAFLDAYVKLMTSRYKDAVNSENIRDYATNLKKKGYFEDDLDHYMGQLAGMKSLSKAASTHRSTNPNLYALSQQEPTKKSLAATINRYFIKNPILATNDAIEGPTLPDTVVVGKRPQSKSNLFQLNTPSLMETLKLNIGQWMLKMAGMFPEPSEEDLFYNDINNGMLLMPRIR